MGLYGDAILPRGVHWLMKREPFTGQRPRCVAGARGRVLELGFGSGLNLPHYGEGVRELLAVDPARVGRELARPLVAAARFPVEYVDLEDGRLPLEDGSVDCVTSTWTLCTIGDLGRALAEARRVLRAGGELRFLEHGHSPDAGVARWQRRLEPLQKLLAGGCHLTRPIDRLVAEAGFELESLEQYALPGPRFLTWTYSGVAARP